MRIFFSVGEPSGDLHASNLIRHLKTQDPEIECVGYGGPKMKAAGCELLFDLTSFAVMFLWEALKNIRTFLRLARDAESYFRENRVDAVVLIDYPGFNWWIAKRAKRAGIPVYYYGVPQMWAWGGWRVKKIQKYVDHVLCKLPFEVDWFAKRGCKATYVGHPYFDQLANQTYDAQFIEDHQVWMRDSGQQMLLLLPGSRKQEVERNLPILLKAAEQTTMLCKKTAIVVASYNREQFEMAQQVVSDSEIRVPVHVHCEATPELMRLADVCLACSGSVSLELMHYRRPTVIVYKLSPLFMFLQRYMLQTRFITLVNLIAAKDITKKSRRPYDPDAANAEATVMPEYLTTGDPSKPMAGQAAQLLIDRQRHSDNVRWLDRLATQYAIPGATGRAADYLLETLTVCKKDSETRTVDSNKKRAA